MTVIMYMQIVFLRPTWEGSGTHLHIGVDFGGNPGARPPKNRKTPMPLSVLTTFCSTKIWVCPPSFFDKSTPAHLRVMTHSMRGPPISDWGAPLQSTIKGNLSF